MDPAVLDAALERSPVGDDGHSGAALERLLLPDGSRVVVKRYDPSLDLLMQMLADDHGREVDLFHRGVLDLIPRRVRHPIIDAWFDQDGLGVVVMRDLGPAVLTWEDRVPRLRAEVALGAVAELHAAFRRTPPEGLTPLADVLGLFEVPRLRRFAGVELVDLALRGWDLWSEVAPGEVGSAVLALAWDTEPLVRACGGFAPTLLHGDLATVNMAFEPDAPDSLTLIDWGLATAGPAEVDLGRLLAGCGHLFDASLQDLLDLHRVVAGRDHDEHATSLGLLTGLVWLGWNKALDVVEHPDPAVRERERTNLAWWLRQAGRALDAGLV